MIKPYFSHDYYSRTNPKLIKLQIKLGHAGKGIFWDLIEILHEENGFIKISDIELISYQIRADIEIIKSIFFDFDLFENDSQKIWSNSVLKRIEKQKQKSEILSKNGKKGGRPKANEKQMLSGAKANEKQMLSGAKANEKQKESKEEKEVNELNEQIKEKDIDINMPFTPPDDIKSIQIIFSDWNNIICKQYPEFQKITESEFEMDIKLQQLLYKLKDKWETGEILTLYGTNEWLRLNAKFLKWWNINNYEKALQGKFDSYKQNAVVKMEDDPWADCEIVNPPKNWKGKK